MCKGKEHAGTSFETTPMHIAKAISKDLGKNLLVAKVRYPDGKIHDIDEGVSTPIPSEEEQAENPKGAFNWHDALRPFEGDVELELYTFDDPEGTETFWHSSAHVLGEIMEHEFGVHLCHGPPT